MELIMNGNYYIVHARRPKYKSYAAFSPPTSMPSKFLFMMISFHYNSGAQFHTVKRKLQKNTIYEVSIDADIIIFQPFTHFIYWFLLAVVDKSITTDRRCRHCFFIYT